MKEFKNIAVLFADEIDKTGYSILKNSGFKILEHTGLSNNELINILNDYKNLNIILVIRSVRKLSCRELKLIKQSGNVILIYTASSGYDNIDIACAKKLKLKIKNVPDGNYVSAAEHTIAIILSIYKNINAADSSMKKGIFMSGAFNNNELKGKTIGIIGVGRVGSYVAKLCKAFGMKILGNDIKKHFKYKYRWIEFIPLNDLLKRSDIVTIHTPLDETTRNLINYEALNLMKANSVLVNCARGGIVNENILISFLEKKKIRYAGLDVFLNEPEFDLRFTKLNNVLLTPHIAGKTNQSKVRISLQLAQDILRFARKSNKFFN